MIHTGRKSLVGVLALLWLALVISLYYVTHKPFSPALAFNLAEAVWQTGLALAIVSVSGGLGARLLPGLGWQPLARLSLQAALGLGLLGLGILLLGATLGISPLLAWLALLVCGLVFRIDILTWWRNLAGLGSLWKRSGRLGKAVAGGAALILFSTLLTALAPPVKFDALVYHLALPHAYLAAGRIVYVPQVMFWGMPQLGEMLYTWAIALGGGDQAAAVLGWMAGVLALVGVVGYVEERLGTRPAWISLAALLSGFTLGASLAWGYVDWLAILFGLAFLAAMECWRREGRSGDLRLAGAFAGLALGTKYTAGVLVLAGLVSLVLHSRKNGGLRQLSRSTLQFSFWAGLFALPWLVKNFLATGNPLYPFIFPAGAMDRLRLDLYQNGAAWGNWQDVLLLPLRATWIGLEAAPGYSASIGPLLLGLGACAWLGWSNLSARKRVAVQNAAWIALPAILLWMVVGRFSAYLLQSRLYFAIFPALAVLAGAGFAGLARQSVPGIRLGRIAGALVLMALWFNAFELGVFTLQQGAPQALLGIQTREAYLSNNLGWFAPTMQAIGELPPESAVLMLWETRSLYCAPKCIPDEVVDRWLHDLYGGDPAAMQNGQAKLPSEILQTWRGAGYTHVLVYEAGMDFLRREDPRYRLADWQALEELLAQLPAPVSFGGAYSLYALAP